MISNKYLTDFAQNFLKLERTKHINITPLSARGSDRTFYRLFLDNKESVILIHYDPKRVENAYYADIDVFLSEISVSVPRLICHDPAQCLMIIEDMGDVDLWSLRHKSWEVRKTLYQKTLEIINRLHSFHIDDFPHDRVKLMGGFDPALYCWEQDYFREHFIGGVCRIDLDKSIRQGFEAELLNLSERLLGTKQTLIHRDLQSQNIMIKDNEPYLIDFQGMRTGCPLYDIGSLLNDPYVEFSEAEIEELLFFYYKIAGWDWGFSSFQDCFWEASCQRLMQALGAYGFLGLTKGLKSFLEHIPSGLNNLIRAASHVSILPKLLDITHTCREVYLKKSY